MGHTSESNHTLHNHLDHLVPWYCLINLEHLLAKVDIRTLSEEQISALERFDFHYFPETSMQSITFVNGSQAVAILRGIRAGCWSKETVRQNIKTRLALT